MAKLYDNYSFSKLVIGRPEMNRKGVRSVYIQASLLDNSTPKVQLVRDGEPLLKSPFGLNGFDEAAHVDHKNLELTITTPDLLEFFNNLDEYIQQVAIKNCDAWFKKTLSEMDIRNMYRPTLTKSDKGYQPTVGLKVNVGDKKPVQIFRARRTHDSLVYTHGSLEDLNKANEYMPIISLSGLWFMNRQFGVSLSLSSMLVFQGKKHTFPFSLDVPAVNDCVPDTDDDSDLDRDPDHHH